MDLPHLHLQYDRLHRHHASALRFGDEISFLDLAHSLRIWVEMKEVVTALAKQRNVTLSFGNYVPTRDQKKALREFKAVSVPLAGSAGFRGLTVSHLARLPTNEEVGRLLGAPPTEKPSMMNFSEWMAADACTVPSGHASHPVIHIAREKFIKRIANRLGASHPDGMCDEDDPRENEYDQYILELHKQISVGGLPVTYMCLIEIGGSILASVKPLRDLSG